MLLCANENVNRYLHVHRFLPFPKFPSMRKIYLKNVFEAILLIFGKIQTLVFGKEKIYFNV